MKRIAMWSGPRNISTALMRSWENRSDTMVIDEPFYGYYLKVTGADHPGRDAIVSAMETDWHQIVSQLLGDGDGTASIFYQKQMAHHMLPEIDLGWAEQMTQAFLVRDPTEMIPSLHEKLPNFDLQATGLPVQWALFKRLLNEGHAPIVLDARAVLENPEGQLKALCHRLGVPFEQAMLSWPAGTRDTDGVWAPHWYETVERSTGFQPYRSKERPIPAHLKGVFLDAVRIHEKFKAHCLSSVKD